MPFRLRDCLDVGCHSRSGFDVLTDGGGDALCASPRLFVPFVLPSDQRGCYGFAADTLGKKTN